MNWRKNLSQDLSSASKEAIEKIVLEIENKIGQFAAQSENNTGAVELLLEVARREARLHDEGAALVLYTRDSVPSPGTENMSGVCWEETPTSLTGYDPVRRAEIRAEGGHSDTGWYNTDLFALTPAGVEVVEEAEGVVGARLLAGLRELGWALPIRTRNQEWPVVTPASED